MTDTTINNTEENTESKISFGNLWLATLGFWSSIGSTKTFVGICAMFAAILAAEFAPFPYRPIVLGLAFGLVPVVVSSALQYGKDDVRFVLANLMFAGFYALFFIPVATVIGSFTMFVAGVFPPVLNIAIGSLIGTVMVSAPFVASLHWHRRGTAAWKIIVNLCAVYTALVWVVMQFIA